MSYVTTGGSAVTSRQQGLGSRTPVRLTSMAVGGDAVGRLADGRAVFVTGALPGEVVVVRTTEDHGRYLRAVLEEVVEGSPDRVTAPCPFVAAGCGGCGWQHIRPEAQLRFKVSMASDALERIAKVRGVVATAGGGLAPTSYRTTVRVAVGKGAPSGGLAAQRARAGFRAARSHEVVLVDDCLVAHPWLSEMLAHGDFGSAREAVLRCGARTGDRMAVLAPRARGARFGGGAVVVGTDELTRRRGGGVGVSISEEVAGTRLRLSPESFFQSGPEAAELLVSAVTRALADSPPGPFVDAYAGVGLFAATVGADRKVTMVESSQSAVADARWNVPGAEAVCTDVRRWAPVQAAVVVADPPRGGLGSEGADVLTATGARSFVLVSCDAGSMGRDVGLLVERGFRPQAVEVLDLFPGTPHLEIVALLVR